MVAEAGIEPAWSRLMRPPRSPSLPSAPKWRGQRDSNPYCGADNAVSCPSTMSPSRWSARGDSNPDLHGLNVLRLPIAPRAILERMAGFEPAPQGLEGPQAAVTPHSLWFGRRVEDPSLPAGQRAMHPPHPGRTWTGVVHRPIDYLVSCQRPRSLRAHPLVRPDWRQRQDSNLDPRALEARMLPLHHAADGHLTSRPPRQTRPPPTWRGPSSAGQAKQKRPSRGSP